MPLTTLPLNRVYLAYTLSEPAFGDTRETIFYVKMADGKRSVVRQSAVTGLAQSVTTEPMPAGGIGYGGAIFAVREDTLAYAAKDGKLYGIDLTAGDQWPVTPAYEGVAAPAISPCGKFVAFLAEQDGRCNVLLADVRRGGDDTRGGDTGVRPLPIKLSNDPWYAFNPAFSPDGTRLAWQEWNEMDMPWDEARLIVARFPKPTSDCASAIELLPLTTTTIARPRVGYASPQFSPDGRHLAFTSDETGWRSLWVADADGQNAARVDTGEGEIGGPDWVPGLISMRWSGDGKSIYAVRRLHSRDGLLRVAWPEKTVTEIETQWTDMDTLNVSGDELIFIASTPTTPLALVTLDAKTGRGVERATSAVGLIDSDSLSEPEVISWRTASEAQAWGILYRAVGPEAEKSPRPLIVHIHGGPTSEAPLTWAPQAQYFATRGWRYLFVNYRGGTGFGRAYQDLLSGQWGVVDIQDARTGAEHLISAGLADPQRVVVTGTSAGGYTTLMALTQAPDFWAAGMSFFGIGNMYEVRIGSHRFEVNYEQGLIGRLPEAGPLWKERSPLTHVKNVRAPVLLFHGTDDKAVPHQQSVEFAEAVKRIGGIAELVSYEGEGHGFLKEANRRDMFEKMEKFLDKYVLCLQK
ncbi:MAG: S9 family peptidase [Chloroflexi bacterium]|nr:S9 family peptidase [Chloroflexota bacterium]